MAANPLYAAPLSDLETDVLGEVTRKKRYVITAPNTQWPSRCYKCNEPTELKKETKLTYVNPFVYLSILITFLLTIVLVLIFQKKFKLKVPLCEKHIRKRKIFLVTQWVSATAALFVCIGGLMLFNNGTMSFIGMWSFFVVLVFSCFTKVAYATKFVNGQLWMKGAGKKFLKSLPEYQN